MSKVQPYYQWLNLGICGARRFWNGLRQWFPWTIVRIFGSLTYFNISYAVLLVVPILHELYARAVPIMQWLGAPGEFPVTLQWLYAASLTYAAAILLYQVCCPPEIKHSRTREDYIQSEFEVFQRYDPHHRVEIVLARLHPESDVNWRNKIEALLRESNTASTSAERESARTELDALLAKMHAHAVQEYLGGVYDMKNLSRPLARWLSLALYISGCVILFGLLIVGSIEVFSDYREGRVLIKTKIDSIGLQMNAYTFLVPEFQPLERVLESVDVPPKYLAIAPDRYGREGRRYYTPKELISHLADRLKGRFDPQTGQFTPLSAAPGGVPYACREKKLGGRDGPGCKNMQAIDDSAAIIACSLIAGSQGWYYGEARKGNCSQTR
ncbi:MAG: hypothetical protein M5U16_12715 [Hyphomicrobium sp.]|nr:hypothetical protein [Hyphomicrobium sp.]